MKKHRFASFRTYLESTFYLRHHMGLILLSTGLAGVLFNKLLLTAGLDRLMLRYPLAVVTSFAVFLLSMRVWLLFLSNTVNPSELPCENADCDDEAKTSETKESAGSAWDALDFADIGAADEGGCLILLFLLLCLVIFGAGVVLIYEAPLILADAGFEFLLAAGLIRSTRRIQRPDWNCDTGWLDVVVKRTWKPFAVVLGFALIFGIAVELTCSSPTTMHDVIHSCRRK